MPQFLNTDFPQALEKIVDDMVESSLPTLSTNSWAQALQSKGLTVDQLADQFIQALTNCKPSQKVTAISNLLKDLGVTKGPEAVLGRPTIVVNGENVQLNQLILPERKF